MTEKELNKLYWIEKRIKKLEARIKELEDEIGIRGVGFDGMPHGTGVSSPVEALVIKKCDLLGDLQKELLIKIGEERRIRNYISTVEDEEVKLIMEMRFINLMSWFEIGEKMHLDRTSVSKKMRKYLNTH
ncbi:MAG: hypothetical protein ACI4IK_01545 [Eubacterium sp.]